MPDPDADLRDGPHVSEQVRLSAWAKLPMMIFPSGCLNLHFAWDLDFTLALESALRPLVRASRILDPAHVIYNMRLAADMVPNWTKSVIVLSTMLHKERRHGQQPQHVCQV